MELRNERTYLYFRYKVVEVTPVTDKHVTTLKKLTHNVKVRVVSLIVFTIS